MEQNHLSAVGLKSRIRGLRVTSIWALGKGSNLIRQCLHKEMSMGLRPQVKMYLSRWSSEQSCNKALNWDQAGMFEETKANLESVLSKMKGPFGAKSSEPHPPLKLLISILGFLQWPRNSYDSVSVCLMVTLPRVTLNVGSNLVVAVKLLHIIQYHPCWPSSTYCPDLKARVGMHVWVAEIFLFLVLLSTFSLLSIVHGQFACQPDGKAYKGADIFDSSRLP